MLLSVFLWLLTLPALHAGEALLEVVLPDTQSFVTVKTASPAVPEVSDGKLLVIGSFSDPAFSVSAVEQIRLEQEDGTPVPCILDTEALFSDFGEIVGVRLAFTVPSGDAGKLRYRIRWGEDVRAEHTALPSFQIDPKMQERYRTFRLVAKTGSAGGENVAEIVVIADEHADYYSLWYLLPMALIFVLLSIRKRADRDRAV